MHLAPSKNRSHGRLLLLAPSKARIPQSLGGATVDPHRHEELLGEMQQFRGKLYLQEEAIFPSDLSSDGRHQLAVDERAWHLLALDADDNICGSVRYVNHPNTISLSQLGIQNAALAHCNQWGTTLRAAVDSEVALARRQGVSYVEVGGWALAPELRHTVEALRMALATYSLARLLGGCIGITTATERNCSADILCRIGGAPLAVCDVELPPYYDPQYRCRMQILRFDSNKVNPRFEPWVTELSGYLKTTPVILATSRSKWAAMADHASSDHATNNSWSLEQNLVRAV